MEEMKKLSLAGIKNRQMWEKVQIELPSYDIVKIRENTMNNPCWVHFGVGNIFRIFIGGIADDLIAKGFMNKGITCVESFDYDVIDKIYKPYDNLALAVTLRANESMEKRVIGSLTEAIKADSCDKNNWNRLQEIFENQGLQMVSFTITEKGYALTETDNNFYPYILRDIENGPEKPVSAMAIIVALLYVRFQAGCAPIAVVSMDNCSRNGEKLKSSVETIALEWKKRGYVEEGFVSYLQDEERVSFPWTMIDKITPRPAQSVYMCLKQDGVQDMEAIVTSKNTYIAPFVNAEEPQYLVIEDKFPNGRPPLEKAGVYMTDRETVNRVERMKVTTCLNPLHTALAVYGCLLGYQLIADEMKDCELLKLVKQIGLQEGMPVVTNPGIISPEEFVNEVINVRLPNPYMPDTPQRIATDTSQKVGIRYGETIKSYLKMGKDIKALKAIPLAIAGWCRYLLGVDDNGMAFTLSSDPMLEELTQQLTGIEVGKPESYQGQLKGILSNERIFGVNLYQAGVGELIETMFQEEIAGKGEVRATLKKYLE